MIQPMADDLHWIQIEDFVDIFTRVYVVNDLSFEKKYSSKRFVSKWLPGDYLVGSGGPPVVIERHELPHEEEEEADEEFPQQSLNEPSFQTNSMISSESQLPTQKSPPILSSKIPKEPKPPRYHKVAFLSETFTDNPMFPFTVAEPARVVISLYQLDQRWNVGRLGDDVTSVPVHRFMPRQNRLESVMQYSVGIAFLVVRLSGMKVRVTDFKLRKIGYTSKKLVFANANNVYLDLFPGRYAVIPYTHCILDRAMDYALHFQYIGNQVEFEIEDPILQRLQDRAASDDGIDDENEPDDNDLLQVANEETDDVSVLSYDRAVLQEEDMEEVHVDNIGVVKPSDLKQSAIKDGLPNGDENSLTSSQQQKSAGRPDGTQHIKLVPLPRITQVPAWEYRENVDDLAMMHMYGEVGNMMKYLRSLRGEIRKLNGTIRALTMTDRGQNIMVQQQPQHHG